MKILIIEDEFALADALSTKLQKQNYNVDIITDGLEGYYYAKSNVYDLIILDVMLPNMDGFEILKKLREENIISKIIMLTAKSTLENKLNGLENGANDYITKPFHIEEVIARVNIQLKEPNNKNTNILTFNDLELNIKTSTLKSTNTNEEVTLVCKEFQLLEYFIKNSNLILKKEQIYNKVWGINNEIESNNLEAYLSFVRKKLKAIGSTTTIKSLRGLGYKMEEINEEVKK